MSEDSTGTTIYCHGVSEISSITNDLFYLSEANQELLPGLKWGSYCQLYTPAFWKHLYEVEELDNSISAHRFGSSIVEEVVACLLGGYGMPSELGLLAFNRMKDYKLISRNSSFSQIIAALKTPFDSCDGQSRRYRFYNTKSKYVYNFLQRKDLNSIPTDNDLELRSWLLSVEGIGFKTASWITRNWLKSENVAILDVHLLRAGKITGFFNHMDVVKQYLSLERAFIEFCKALDTLPSKMDALIWAYMKKTNTLALRLLVY